MTKIIFATGNEGKMREIRDIMADLDVELSSFVTVADAKKCKMYIKNFGEFYLDQIEHAKAIILSRTQELSEEKLEAAVKLLREHNAEAKIITTPWDDLTGAQILQAMEGDKSLADKLLDELAHEPVHEHHHHHDHDHDEHDHEHHHDHDEHEHHHHHDHDDECSCGHDHHHDHDDDEHEHEHHHHDHDEREHHHDHDHDEDEHEHHHHHDHDEDHDHEHHHEHDENCTCGCHDHDHDHHHHHHHADEVFTSWGIETPNTYSAEDIEKILTALDSGEYGAILRAKGMVPAPDGTWVYYDYVPEEHDIRSGKPEVTGKICVIGSKLDEDKLAELFRK